MLHNIYVKNLALIDEMEVELNNGLNILTGETGAGKSIILGSVNLALGGRYSSEMLRNEEEAGYVELTFFVDNEAQLKLLKEKEVYAEDGVVTLSRKMVGKRSVSKINGETVQISQIKEVAAILIDIHGQHEHQSLLYKKNHLSILDAFAKDETKNVKEQTVESYHQYKTLKEELDRTKTDEKERNKEMGFLEYEINEIRNAQLKECEDILLEEQYRRMLNGQRITESISEAYSYTASGKNNVSDMLSQAIRCMQETARIDERVNALNEQLAEVDSLLNDFNRELSDYCSSFEFSVEEFYEVEQRLNEINRLKAKYGNSIEEILLYCRQKEEELIRLQNYDAYIETLKKDLEQAEETVRKNSETLSLLRKQAAKVLQSSIKEGLLDLNFLNVQFEIVFKNMESYSAHGIDDVEFMISLNPGATVRPLAEVASGGELSRIMLAIKTVMAEKDQIETLIFDEIDVGISGRTAQKVSEKLAVLGKKHQVICITHLAQIAAMADAHYAIEKQVVNGKTVTRISLLNEKQEIDELARILGGVEITETVIQSATEMKELAMRTK